MKVPKFAYGKKSQKSKIDKVIVATQQDCVQACLNNEKCQEATLAKDECQMHTFSPYGAQTAVGHNLISFTCCSEFHLLINFYHSNEKPLNLNV